LRRCRIGFFLIATSLAFSSLHAGTQQLASLQVGHDYWTSKDGAPGDIQALAQTDDGFLWLGSSSGLFRFDGTRFERFRPPFGGQLLSTNVMCLLAPPSGGLWIGYTFGGFSFLYNGHLTNYPLEVPVRHFARDRNGIVWAATSAGLWKFDGRRWQQVGAEGSAPTGAVFQIEFDAQGTLWILAGIDFGAMDLLYLKAGAEQFRTAAKGLLVLGFTLNADGEAVTEPEPGWLISGSGGYSNVHLSAWPVLRRDSHQIVDRNKSVWIAPKSPAVVMRLSSKDNLQDAVAKASPSNSETWDFSPFPFAKLIDREGNIWLGEIKGLHRFWYSPFNKLDLPKTAAENMSFALAPDVDGAVWMSVGGWYTPSVLLHTSGGKAEYKPIQAEIHAPFAHRAPDGTFWFIGKDCLLHLVGRKFVRVSLPPEIASQALFLQAIAEDQRGGMWVSFLRFGLYRLADGVWTRYGGYNELPKTAVLAEFTDNVGRVWLGYIKNQLALLDGDHVRLFGSADDLRLGNITAIYGRGSRIWIGGEFGLAEFDNGRLQNVSAVDDEWLHGISGIVETNDGDLWLNGLSGIFHISKTEISEASRNSSYRVKGEHFGRRDGLPGVPTQLHPLPTAIEGTDGRLWFALQNGVVWLDPATYSEHGVAPPAITIESVSADDKGYAPASSLSFPARTSSVQISYAAVSLSDPEATRFRYKLQETDGGWHEVAAASPVTYRNLPPGSYHFNVTASDTNGIWSNKVATADFTILPAFYQTLWFRSLCVITFAVLLAGLYQFRLKHLTRQYSIRLEERVNERTRIARELHDTVLQSFQGVLLKFSTLKYVMRDRPVEAEQTLERLVEQARQAITEGRDAVQGLRDSTVVANDLARAIGTFGEGLAADQTGPNSPEFRVQVEGKSRDLPPLVRDEVYHVACESLRNAFHHAQAQRIDVEIRYDPREFRLRVLDNGKGIDPAVLSAGGRAGHHGLPGLKERAELAGGSLSVWSRVDSGTEIELSIPASTAYIKSATPRRPMSAGKETG
jgi:signal transduction histidine kinase/ligand-binding sensor domain-containing protein